MARFPLTILGEIAKYAASAAECNKFRTACVGAKDYCDWGFLGNTIRKKLVPDPENAFCEWTPFPLEQKTSCHVAEVIWYLKVKAMISLAELCDVVRKLLKPQETPNVRFADDENAQVIVCDNDTSEECDARINALKKWGMIDIFFKHLKVHLSRSIKENEAAILEGAVFMFFVLGPCARAQIHCVELVIGAMALKCDNYVCQLSAVKALHQFNINPIFVKKLEPVCFHLRWAVEHFTGKGALCDSVLEFLDNVMWRFRRDENIPAAIRRSHVFDGIVRSQMEHGIRPRVWAWILDHLPLAGSGGDATIVSCVSLMLEKQSQKWYHDVTGRKRALETVLALVRDRILVHKLPGCVLYHMEQIHHYCYEHHATLQLCWKIFQSLPRQRWWREWVANMHTCSYIYSSIESARVQMQELTVTKDYERLPFAGAMLYLPRGTEGVQNLEQCHSEMESLTTHVVAGLEALTELMSYEQNLKWNVLECVKNLMNDAYTNVRLQVAACSFLSDAASWQSDFQRCSHILGIHKLVARAMSLFPEHAGLQHQACAVLRQL